MKVVENIILLQVSISYTLRLWENVKNYYSFWFILIIIIVVVVDSYCCYVIIRYQLLIIWNYDDLCQVQLKLKISELKMIFSNAIKYVVGNKLNQHDEYKKKSFTTWIKLFFFLSFSHHLLFSYLCCTLKFRPYKFIQFNKFLIFQQRRKKNFFTEEKSRNFRDWPRILGSDEPWKKSVQPVSNWLPPDQCRATNSSARRGTQILMSRVTLIIMAILGFEATPIDNFVRSLLQQAFPRALFNIASQR